MSFELVFEFLSNLVRGFTQTDVLTLPLKALAREQDSYLIKRLKTNSSCQGDKSLAKAAVVY